MGVPIKVISYDQTNAPQLTGEVGKLDAILYAALVTGFNTQAISSITVTANVATVATSAPHGYQVYDTILVSGANESVFNDEFTIDSVPTSTSFTFAITTTTTPATGSLSCKIAPLGWLRSFSGTNISVYKINDVMSTGLYLRVDDTGARSTQVNMYETMTTIDVGTGKSQDTWWAKSSVANTATHQWYLVGNSKCFYLMTEVNVAYPYGLSIYFFGDTISFRANDPWCCALGGQSVADQNYGNQSTGMIGANGATTGMCLARASNWIGGYVPFGMYANPRQSPFGYGTLANGPFPSPIDNACHLFPVYIWETVLNSWRGKMPGLFCPGEYINGVYPNKDRSVVIDGKTYMAFRLNVGGNLGVWGNFFLSLDQSDWS